MSNTKKTSYLMQGSILAAASIVSRIIGLLYRMPLTAIIGDHGNDYYSTAFEIYNILLLISSYSIPTAVSKMVASRMALRQKRNAYRVFQGAFIFALISGTAAALIVLIGAGPFTTLLKTPLAIYALRVLSPTLVIVAILGVFRGFYQGLGTMIPSAISQVVEQIVNAVVSVAAAYFLFKAGSKVASELYSSQEIASAYGAAGGTLGTGAGAVAGLAFVLFVFFAFRSYFIRSIKRQEAGVKVSPRLSSESYGSVMRVLIMTIVPILLSTTVYNLVAIVNQILFKNIATAQMYAPTDISVWWGVYSGKYSVLTNVPKAIASALAVSAVPTLTAAFAQHDSRGLRSRIGMSLRFETVVAFPCAVGLIVLASPIQQLLFRDGSELAERLLVIGGISVIFYAISTFSNAALQSIDQMRIPVRNAVIALIVQAVAMVISMLVFHLGIYAVVVAHIVFSLLMCILNGISVKRYTQFQPDIMKTFIKPAISSVIMGAAAWIVYFVLHKVTGNAISTIVSILASIIVYSVSLLLTKGLTEEELRSFPKGTLVIRFAKKFRLL